MNCATQARMAEPLEQLSLPKAKSFGEDFHSLRWKESIYNRNSSSKNLSVNIDDIRLIALIENKLDHVAGLVLAKAVDSPSSLNFDGWVKTGLEKVYTRRGRESDADIASTKRNDKNCRPAGGSVLEVSYRLVSFRGTT